MELFNAFIVSLQSVWTGSGFSAFTMGHAIMIAVGLVLLYMAFVKEFEPLLLGPIAFGCILANFPGTGFLEEPGLMQAIHYGIANEIFPPLIFLGIGAMTDFGPLLARPVVLLLGAAAQIGVFVALVGAMLLGFNVQEAGAIGIIGGADGPTAIYLSIQMAPHLLGAIAVAAYSYMSLVPLIQPPIMKLLTSQKEREVQMDQLRPVTKFERVMFPIVATILISLLLPPIAALLGMLMLGNLFRESGVTDRLSDTAQNSLCNIVGAPDPADHLPGPCGFRCRYCRWCPLRQAHVPSLRLEDQSPDWFRRCFRRAYGCPRQPDGGHEGQARQLPADARHGPQCGRRYRYGSSCRHYAGYA